MWMGSLLATSSVRCSRLKWWSVGRRRVPSLSRHTARAAAAARYLRIVPSLKTYLLPDLK